MILRSKYAFGIDDNSFTFTKAQNYMAHNGKWGRVGTATQLIEQS